ncbi:MAG TPA: hypothetical protein VJ572_06295 [Azonexus sp.]|nr:hypothetical protein [Azonexus sp.]
MRQIIQPQNGLAQAEIVPCPYYYSLPFASSPPLGILISKHAKEDFMRIIVLIIFVVVFSRAAYSQSKDEDLLWDRIADATANRIQVSIGESVTAQYYGAIFVAQDLLLNAYSFGYDLNDDSWKKLLSALNALKSLRMEPPERTRLAKLWRTEMLMNFSKNDQVEILKFLRSEVGERFVRSALLSRSSLEFDISQEYRDVIGAAESKFNKEVGVIIEEKK